MDLLGRQRDIKVTMLEKEDPLGTARWVLWTAIGEEARRRALLVEYEEI